MIIYFSATGNSKYTAQKIAEALNDRAVSIADIDITLELNENETLGIVTPVYHWGLPSIVSEFFSRFELNARKDTYIYYIATYGTTTGQAGVFMRDYFENRGFEISSMYCVKMPDTWTPAFNLSDKNKIARINREADEQILEIIGRLEKRERGDFMKNKVPMPAVRIYHPTYETSRKTSHLHAEEQCIGCGLCAVKCPVNAIEMRDKKPVWVKEKCVMCLGCLHRCPKFAIQYDNKTKHHGQYIHPKI